VLEAAHGASMLAVVDAGVRGETTAQMVGRVADLVRDGLGEGPVDLVLCLAGVSDARRLATLGRTLLAPDQTRANLVAIRKLAEPLLSSTTRRRGQPWPRWVWLTPPRVDPDAVVETSVLGAGRYRLDPASVPLAGDDVAAVAAAVRAAAADHPGDVLLDLHAMRQLFGIYQVPRAREQPGSPGGEARARLVRHDTPYLSLPDHVEIARAVVDLLSPAGVALRIPSPP
jgi:hypothetical protein